MPCSVLVLQSEEEMIWQSGTTAVRRARPNDDEDFTTADSSSFPGHRPSDGVDAVSFRAQG